MQSTAYPLRAGFPANCSSNFLSGCLAHTDVGEGREHDCMDAGGRAASGTAAEDAASFANIRVGPTITGHRTLTGNKYDAPFTIEKK